MISPDEGSYEFNGLVIPAHMVYAINQYVEIGRSPGHFLSAVICNDLSEACGRADHQNRFLLAAYIGYLYYECPSACWGTPEKMAAWVTERLAERHRILRPSR